MPRDPEDTLANIERTGILRIGRSATSDPAAAKRERAIASIAQSMGARLEVREGSEQAMLQALQAFELDLVAVELSPDNPWAEQVALSTPYATVPGPGSDETARVLALPPGENAWLLRVDQILDSMDAP